jgi:hypothetical protein
VSRWWATWSSRRKAASSSGVAARPTMSDSPASRWTTAPEGRPGTGESSSMRVHREEKKRSSTRARGHGSASSRRRGTVRRCP